MKHKPVLHGFALRSGGEAEFRFGIAAFLGFIWTSQFSLPDREPRAWPFRRIDKRFAHLQSAARHLAFKLERAASLYAEKARDYGAAVVNSNAAARDEDLAILLDAIVVYLRILPDIVAAATPYFYERGSPSSRSFRDQITWFTKSRPLFDPEYVSLLEKHKDWFELLAGKEEKGLRDLLIHRFGTFQFPVTTAPQRRRGEVSADLVTTTGYHVETNSALSEIAQGAAAFLDAYVIHFNNRIRSAAGWAPLSQYDGTGCKILDFSELPESKWLFPVCEPAV